KACRISSPKPCLRGDGATGAELFGGKPSWMWKRRLSCAVHMRESPRDRENAALPKLRRSFPTRSRDRPGYLCTGALGLIGSNPPAAVVQTLDSLGDFFVAYD